MRTEGIRGRSPNSHSGGEHSGVRAPSPNSLGLRPRIPLAAAVAIGAQILWLSSAPYPPAAPFSILWNFLAYASLTLLLWIAARGRRPLAVPGGVILLGACVGDPALAAAAAVLTAGTLFVLQGKPASA